MGVDEIIMEYQENINMMDQNQQQFDQQQFIQPNQYNTQTFQSKPKGINLFQIPIFEIYNPKNATVIFQVDTKNGELGIMMAPALPNNSAINQKGPVQKGMIIYDYSKKVVSTFSDIEIIDLIYFLKDKFLNDNTKRINSILETFNEIKSILQRQQLDQNAFNFINSKLDSILQSNNFNSNNENQFGMYRKRLGMPDRVWNFVYDPSYNMLHINVMTGQDKIRTTLSAKMVLRLLSALESYASNYATIKVLSEIAHSTSKTFAINSFFAPNKEQIKEVD